MKEGERLAKNHVYITHRPRQQRGDGQRERGEEGGAGWRSAKGREWGQKETLLGTEGTRCSV